MQYLVILSNLGQARVGPENDGHLVKVFVDTGANCDTSRENFMKSWFLKV